MKVLTPIFHFIIGLTLLLIIIFGWSILAEGDKSMIGLSYMGLALSILAFAASWGMKRVLKV